MSLFRYFLRTAINNLRRGGQRELVALLCIAFGVMSVVSMTLLSEALQKMMVLTAPEQIGGDITMDRVVEASILPEHVAGLQTLKGQDRLESYTLIAYTSSLVFRRPDSGQMFYPTAGMGIDPATYPLRGAFQISGPENTPAHAADLLREPGDVLVTRDMLNEQGLKLGDTLLLSDLTSGGVLEGHIRGIVTDTPNHLGSKVYYALETARKLAGSEYPENTALLTAPNPDSLLDGLKAQGWRPITAEQRAGEQAAADRLIEFCLKGAGILGMLVGGIGIANTMQVLLRRRRREVAVLKTLGYHQGHIQAMFALEAALLGGLGSLLGAGLGTLISLGLVNLFSGITDLLITWSFSPLPVFTGLLTGFITTISFAMFSVVLTSQVRPLAVLRSEALDTARLPWFATLGLALLCALPFVAVTSLVMGSLTYGAGVLLAALAGLVGLGGFMAALVWIVTRIFPLRGLPLIHMANTNLRRRGMGLVFAMIALFVGVVSLASGVVVSTSAQRAFDSRLIKFDGDNLTILAPAAQENTIRAAAQAQPAINHLTFSYQTPVKAIRLVDNPERSIPPLLIGQTELVDYKVKKGAEWGSRPDGVYLSWGFQVEPGSQVEVTFFDGTTRILPVVGSYQVTLQGGSPEPDLGLLMPTTLSQGLAAPQTIQAYLRAPAAQLDATTTALSKALPQATVLNLPAYAARFTQAFANLFVFAAAMAGLALLAGVLLVANSVSLAMLDRRYEIGVLKSIGYARRQVLFTLVVEYSLVAVIATGAGLLIIQSFLWLLALTNDIAGSLLVMSPSAAGLIALLSIGLTLLTVLGVTWRPVQVSPLIVLNDRE